MESRTCSAFMLVYPVPIRSWKLRGEVGIRTVDTSVDLNLFNIQAVFVFFSRRQFANNQHNLNIKKTRSTGHSGFGRQMWGEGTACFPSLCWDVVEHPCHLLPACTEKPIWNHHKIFHNLQLATTTLSWTTKRFCKTVEFRSFYRFFSQLSSVKSLFLRWALHFSQPSFGHLGGSFCVFCSAQVLEPRFSHKNGRIFPGVKNTQKGWAKRLISKQTLTKVIRIANSVECHKNLKQSESLGDL